MSDNGSAKQKEFLATGAKTYLDVDDAMAQFRRMVQDQITALLSRRLDEINRACEMSWTANDLRDYSSRQTDRFLVGKQVALENFGGLYFYFRISRENAALVYTTWVDLYRQRKNLAVDLWESRRASDTASCQSLDLLFQGRLLSEDKIPDFLESLSPALDDFMSFIQGCGGLKKYLPQMR